MKSIKKSDPMSLDISERPMMVIDLFSGSYVSQYIGHEVLNLDKNLDGRYYGYCPPYDDIDIRSLGAAHDAEMIDGVTIIYVQKQRATKNREVIAFCENATVHKSIEGKLLNRFIDKENGYCSYSIESDTMVDLRTEESKFVIKIDDYSNLMFRRQRFYKGKYVELDKKLFDYLRSILSKKEIDDDSSFQLNIQEVDDSICTNVDDNSKEQPIYGTGNNSLVVNKNAKVSKQVLIASKYKCAGDNNHVTFETTKGKPYMEGHHLIPCTYTNSMDFWDKGFNIDCQANIVCLCPTCHRQIHYGSNTAKKALVEKLYKLKNKELKSCGITLSLKELLKLYSIDD